MVVVLMGGYAQQLEKMFCRWNSKVKIIKTAHPAVFQFLDDELFKQVQKAEIEVFGCFTDFAGCSIVKK